MMTNHMAPPPEEFSKFQVEYLNPIAGLTGGLSLLILLIMVFYKDTPPLWAKIVALILVIFSLSVRFYQLITPG